MTDPQRTSDKHGPLLDEEMKQEVEGQVRSGRPTRAEEWHDPEPIEDENAPEPGELVERRRDQEAGRARGGGGEQGDGGEQGGDGEADDAVRTT